MGTIVQKLSIRGNVYGHIEGTNLYLLRWVITNEQVAIINQIQGYDKDNLIIRTEEVYNG